MLFIFYFVGSFNIWPFLYKVVILCLSPSVCSSTGIACSLLFLLFMAEFWSLRVAPQPMLADCLLSGSLLYLMVLVLQCAAQPLQVECYSIKLASSWGRQSPKCCIHRLTVCIILYVPPLTTLPDFLHLFCCIYICTLWSVLLSAGDHLCDLMLCLMVILGFVMLKTSRFSCPSKTDPFQDAVCYG